MKKLRFSKYAAPVFAFAFSIFIVACLKEQSNTSSKSEEVDLIEFAKQHYPNIKFLNTVTKATSRIASCIPEPEPDLNCETRDVQMIVPIPAIANFPACDVTVNFTVRECRYPATNSHIFLDITNLEYTACQDVLRQLDQIQLMGTYQDYQTWEEIYAYHVSINAEYLFSNMVAQANPIGQIVETNYYSDLCYRLYVYVFEGKGFAQSRDICGTACCHRYRTYISNGPNTPPTPTPPRYQQQGECEVDNDNGLGSCTRTCGPLD